MDSTAVTVVKGRALLPFSFVSWLCICLPVIEECLKRLTALDFHVREIVVFCLSLHLVVDNNT